MADDQTMTEEFTLTGEIAAVAETPVKKRRGRPPKKKPEAVENSSLAAPVVSVAPAAEVPAAAPEKTSAPELFLPAADKPQSVPESENKNNAPAVQDGAVAENLTFDILSQKDNRLVVKGKNSYSFEEIYPDAENQLLAEVILSKGKNIITVTIEDFFGNSKVATYTVEVI